MRPPTNYSYRLSIEYKLELIAMTVHQIYRRRLCVPNDDEYNFAFVRWTLNVIASAIAILILSSAIFVSIVISRTIEWWV